MVFLIRVVNMLAQLYFFMILAHVVLTWIPHNRNNRFFRFIHEMTEPYLNLFRRLLPFTRTSMIDFSPVIALIVLELVSRLIIEILFRIALL